MTERWSSDDFLNEKVQFFPYTNFRFLFYGTTLVCIFAAMGCLFGLVAEQRIELAAVIAGCILISWISLKLESQLEESYELNRDTLSFHRVLLGRRFSRELASLSDVHRIVVDSKPHFSGGSARRTTRPPNRWSYGLALVLESGKIVRLTEPNEWEFTVAVAAAERLAARFGVQVCEPLQAHYLRVRGRRPPKVTYEPWRPSA